MTREETVPYAERSSSADPPESRYSLAMRDSIQELLAGDGDGDTSHATDDGSKGPPQEDNATNPASLAKAFKSHACLQTLESFPPADTEMESIAVVSNVSPRDSMQILKERLKEKLKEKLKPKLRQNFKNRQEPNLQITWIPGREIVLTSQDDGSIQAHDVHGEPLAMDVAPLKVLPAGVKTGPEHGVMTDPSPFFSMGKEAAGQLVKINGRKKAAIKTPGLSRINRFADDILQLLGDRSVPEKLIREALGNNPDTSKAIRLLLTENRLERLGDGGKGCAYVYARTDRMENKVEPEDIDQVDVSAQAMAIEREFVLELGRRFPVSNTLDPFVWNRYGTMHGDHVECDL